MKILINGKGKKRNHWMSVVMNDDNETNKRVDLGSEAIVNDNNQSSKSKYWMSVVMGNENNVINKKINLGPEAMNNEINERPNYRKDFKCVRLAPKGPLYLFLDERRRGVYPETFHTYDPLYLKNNSLRIYEEHNLIYAYHMDGNNRFVVYIIRMELNRNI